MGKTKTKFIRKNKRDNFTIIDNTFLRRKDMTARAKGLLTYLLALPDDWTVYKEEVFRNFKEGTHAMNTAFNELKELGYINHYGVRNDKGMYIRWECEIFENPENNEEYVKKPMTKPSHPEGENPKLDNPKLDNPLVDNPLVDNHKLQSTYITNNLNNKELKDDEDDDIYIGPEKIVSDKIKNRLIEVGIDNLTANKLAPIGRVINKLEQLYERSYEEAEDVILLAIETYEFKNGQTLEYLMVVLRDWLDKELYKTSEIREYLRSHGRSYGKSNSGKQNIVEIPMYNWLEK